ncbi:MAG: NAD(P)/FAD-dependent oxidoreductase [Verrucomicrobiae bacterium]|nr:NAD(P)/FAD-dependent oxidoreductase [Verrucomicrobiae bacterium]
MKTGYDAVVVGAGPNGLSAAIVLARAGLSVCVVEANETPGGGARTAEFTLPGYRHDVCSAIHPMGIASPLFRELELEKHGLEWIHPEVPLAHPLDDGECVLLARSVKETADQFNPPSARAYRRLFEPLVGGFDGTLGDLLAPPRVPRHPLGMASFGLRILPSTLAVARAWFSDEKARALLAGNAAHSILPLDSPISTNAIGMMLMLAGHAKGWPLIRGGSGRLIETLVAILDGYGGVVKTNFQALSLSDLPNSRIVLFDTSPSAMARIAGDQLPVAYRRRLLRYRHGPGIFKIDYALSEPVPWTNPGCRRAATVHLGGTLDEIVRSERDANHGIHSRKPFVLSAQPSLFDGDRAPDGKHTFWAYCHVPAGSTVDMTEAIESQIERFAPGFRDIVLSRHTMNCRDYERYNPNLIGGDIVGGAADWLQLLTRPVISLRPHETPNSRLFLCSSSTPPGGGVHGMCGYWAAVAALRRFSE